MKLSRFTTTIVAVVGTVLAAPSMSSAWWGFVHYRVAKDIAGVDPDYAMGPDTFPSHSFGIIIAEFSWSHAVMASDLDFPPPDIPQYPHDGRYPGKVMFELVNKKLKPATLTSMQGVGAHEQSPTETALGFLVHNAADNIVHWNYFLGGDTSLACILDGHGVEWMWQTNHAFKEEWASYIVLMLKDARANAGAGAPIELFQGAGEDEIIGTHDDIFSSLSGEGIDGQETDYTDDVFGPADGDGIRRLQPYLTALHPLAFKTNAKLLHLAMKVYRKNRRNTDIEGTVGTGTESSEFSVIDIATIQASFETTLTDPNDTDAAIHELANMTLARFHELNMVASSVNASGFTGCEIQRWHPTDVMARYDQCVTRGAAWLANAGD